MGENSTSNVDHAIHARVGLKKLFSGERLLSRLVKHLFLGWTIAIGIVIFMPEIMNLPSILLALIIGALVATYRVREFKMRIQGNIYFDRANFRGRLSLDIVLYIMFILLAGTLSKSALVKFIVAPLALPFPLTTVVLIVLLLRYERKVGPVYIGVSPS